MNAPLSKVWVICQGQGQTSRSHFKKQNGQQGRHLCFTNTSCYLFIFFSCLGDSDRPEYTIYRKFDIYYEEYPPGEVRSTL